MKSIKISVDFRESHRVLTILEQLGVKPAITRLALGDISTSKVVIEHKSLADVVSSLIDGRLFSQAFRLSRDPRSAWIVIDGEVSEVEAIFKKRVNWKMVIGALVSIHVRYGIPILWFPTLRQAMYACVSICSKVEEGKLGLPRQWVKVSLKRHSPKVDALRRMLRVPVFVCENLLKKFKTIEGVARASKKELMTVSGIGEVRAKKIYDLLH